MKKLLLLPIFLLAAHTLSAQTFNPQFGLTFASLKDLDPNRESRVRIGTQVGMDLRIGDRFYIQPGLHYIQYKTMYTLHDSLTAETPVNRDALKFKALIGFNVIHTDLFKLRLNVGPTVDATLRKDNGGKPEVNENDITNGSFNMDIGLGVDVLFLTMEVGYSNGISKAIKNSPATYSTTYVTIGMAF